MLDLISSKSSLHMMTLWFILHCDKQVYRKVLLCIFLSFNVFGEKTNQMNLLPYRDLYTTYIGLTQLTTQALP